MNAEIGGDPARASDPDWQALDALRERIVGVDAEMSQLLTRRRALVDEYERHRFAILGRTPGTTPTAPFPGPVPAAPERQEWSGSRVRGLLLSLGAALLGISALTFTAVAWSRLGDGGRAALLAGFTVVVTALALGLRRRLPATAEAFAGLAIVLLLIDVYAARRAGFLGGSGVSWQVWWAVGTVVAAGFAAVLGLAVGRRTTRFAVAALTPLAPGLLALRIADTEWAAAMALAVVAAAIVWGLIRWARLFYPEGRVVLGLHATGSWLAAAGLAAVAASQPDTGAAALLPALAVTSLAAAPTLAHRHLADRPLRMGAAALAAGVPAGVVLTLVGPLVGVDGALTTAVVAGGLTMVVAAVLPASFSSGTRLAGAACAVPGTLWALGVAAPAVFGPPEWLLDAWSGALDQLAADVYMGPRTWPGLTGSWAAVGSLVAAAAVGGIIAGRRHRPLWPVVASAAIGFAVALAPVTARASVLVALVATAGTAVLILLGAAWWDRRNHPGWPLLPGVAVAAVPAAGWAAVSPAASVSTLAATTMAAAGAAVIARSPAARGFSAALTALLAVAFVGIAARAAGAGPPAAGFAAALAAGAVVLFGVYLLGDQPVTGTALEATGAVAVAFSVVAAADSPTWLAGTLTAMAPVAALAALRSPRRRVYGIASAALALAAVWAWLAAARVGVVEAYTAPAAAVAFAAGILLWRRADSSLGQSHGRSWLTLGPALILGIGPTLILGMADDDGPRLIVAALLSLAAVLAGAVLRLQAPLVLGAVALLALAIDQWGDEIVRMPRWITLGAVGVLLMWIGATFEARRRDWRRASGVIGRFG